MWKFVPWRVGAGGSRQEPPPVGGADLPLPEGATKVGQWAQVTHFRTPNHFSSAPLPAQAKMKRGRGRGYLLGCLAYQGCKFIKQSAYGKGGGRRNMRPPSSGEETDTRLPPNINFFVRGKRRHAHAPRPAARHSGHFTHTCKKNARAKLQTIFYDQAYFPLPPATRLGVSLNRSFVLQ